MTRRYRIAVPLLLFTLAMACSDDPAGPSGAEVSVADFSFSPSAATISAGETVEWTWTGSAQHDVTFTTNVDGSGAPPASALQASGSYSLTINTAGSYTYYCTIHGTPTSGMRGTVVVQ